MRCRVLLVTAVVLGLIGCRSSTPPPAAPARPAEAVGLLSRVPANTPYVWATLAPVPHEQSVSSMGAVRQALGYLDTLSGVDPDMVDNLDDTTRLIVAAAARFAGKSPYAILQELGIDEDADSVIHGHGLWPVARIELASGPRLRKVAARSWRLPR